MAETEPIEKRIERLEKDIQLLKPKRPDVIMEFLLDEVI